MYFVIYIFFKGEFTVVNTRDISDKVISDKAIVSLNGDYLLYRYDYLYAFVKKIQIKEYNLRYESDKKRNCQKFNERN